MFSHFRERRNDLYKGLFLSAPVEHVPVVLQLLQGEDVLIEILLQFLVGIIDVELFKPIHLEKTQRDKSYTRIGICSAGSSTSV